MSTLRLIAAAALALGVSAASPCLAQAPTPAPATATAMMDGHPDISGLWVISNRSARGFLDENMQPIKPVFTAKAAETVRKADQALDPSAKCLPAMPRQMHGPYPIQIIQRPNMIGMLFEYDTVFRIIYTDGRPRAEENEGGFMGRSLGHWEGDTLVVSTTGVNPEAWLEPNGTPISPKLTLTERFSLTEGGRTLQLITRIDDPEVFVTPVYYKNLYNLKNSWEIKDYICEAGNRDNVFAQKPGQPGSLTVAKPKKKK